MNYDHIFPTLSDQEFAVLYWKCQGMKHEDIALKFNYSMGWIQEHSSSGQKKLGVTGHPRDREKTLENEICPALFEWVKQNPERVKALPPPPEHPIHVPETERPSSSAVEPASTFPKGVKVESKKDRVEQVIIIDDRPPSNPIVRLLRWLLFAIVGFIVLATVYMFGRGSVAAPVTVNSPEIIQLVDTPLPSPAEEVLPSPTVEIVPTATYRTIAPDTPVPTETLPPPSPTIEFIPPADGILFQDNFDNGASDQWRPESGTGTWRVINGYYTFNSEDRFKWFYNFVGDTSWQNYVVELDYSVENDTYADLAIIVRSSADRRYGLAFIVGAYRARWAIWEGDWNVLVEGEGFLKKTGHVRLEVQGNTFTGSVTGFDNLVITDSSTDKGKVGLGVKCRDYSSCPTVDNFQVIYLP